MVVQRLPDVLLCVDMQAGWRAGWQAGRQVGGRAGRADDRQGPESAAGCKLVLCLRLAV